MDTGGGGYFPGSKVAGSEAYHVPLTSAVVKENLDLNIRSPIRVPGVVLNYLSTETTLTLPHLTHKNYCVCD
jgi:hypothetical protein